MSRLAAALKHRDSGERRLLRKPFKYAAVQEASMSIDRDTAIVYRIEAIFRTQVVVDRVAQLQSDGHALTNAVERAKRQITGEIFGEYVAPLYEAIHALDNYEVEDARRLIQAVINNFDRPEPFKTES